MPTDRDETDKDALQAYALDDAINVLTSEQVAYWHYGSPLSGDCKEEKARRSDLDNWIDARATDREWRIYKEAFESAMKAGIKVCEDFDFDTLDEDDDGSWEDGVINDAVDAAKAAVEKLS